ncbi:MAG: ATP-binding protein [Aristaeellaceae bacterium]
MEITMDALAQAQEGSYLLADMRPEQERERGSMPGAVVLPEQALDTWRPETDVPVVLACARGFFSLEAAQTLRERGIGASSLVGGYPAWLLHQLQQKEAAAVTARAEAGLEKKYRQRLWSKFTRAIKTYDLLQPGDRVAVCISGGKDSMLMATLFQKLHRHSSFPFEVEFLVMDPGYSPANRQIIEENARRLSIPIRIFETGIFDAVYRVPKSPCYLCARMRRGYLYSFAQRLGCNKIALGHHFDDVIETIFMGMLYGAQIQTMMPKLHSTNDKDMELIRPMYLIREDDIKAWRDGNQLRFIQCACKFTDTCTTCRGGENPSKRMEAKALIRQLKATNPDIENHIFRSVENVCLDTVIGWKQHGQTHHFLDTYDRE